MCLLPRSKQWHAAYLRSSIRLERCPNLLAKRESSIRLEMTRTWLDACSKSCPAEGFGRLSGPLLVPVLSGNLRGKPCVMTIWSYTSNYSESKVARAKSPPLEMDVPCRWQRTVIGVC